MPIGSRPRSRWTRRRSRSRHRHERLHRAAPSRDALIDEIAAVDPAIGRHLRLSIRTGLTCSYEPEPGDAVDWILDERTTGRAARAEQP